MFYFWVFCILLIRCDAREQYSWSGSDELDEDVELLLKQGLKIGYQPKSNLNSKSFAFLKSYKVFQRLIVWLMREIHS